MKKEKITKTHEREKGTYTREKRQRESKTSEHLK
jgi:hypothetical protein